MKMNALASLTPVRALAVVALVAASVGVRAQDDRQRKQLAPDQELLVNVEDLTGLANIRTDFVRENLLQSAFHNAANDEDWLGDFEFRYNYNVPGDRGGYLEFTVLDWERSVANMYEFRASARYRTLGGETINLGSFFGQQPGITIVTGWEVGDAFISAAESAFEDALEKLREEAL